MCNLNLKKAELKKPIYRIYSIKRFLALLKSNKDALIKPKKWKDDPFENFILKSDVIDEKGKKGTFSFQDDLYAQCWSLNKENDAMWRIYSPQKNGIKVKSNITYLIESLKNSLNLHQKDFCYIGSVKYLKIEQIRKYFKSLKLENILTSDGSGCAETLLIKREAFFHEKEIRIIFFNPYKSTLDFYEFQIDPNYLFSEIVIDPRMEKEKAKKLKTKIKKLGYKGPIHISNLYSPPTKFVLKI